MSSSFGKSSFGKPAGSKHPLRKFALIAIFAGAALWGDYQYYTPDSWKDSVGQKVESLTGSELLGEAFGHKQTVATQGTPNGVQVEVPKAPAPK